MAEIHHDPKEHKHKGKGSRRHPTEYSEVMRRLKPNGNPLGQFIPWPKGYNMEILEEDEVMLLLVRKHWITNVKWILIALGLILMGQLISYVPIFSMLPDEFQFITMVLWNMLPVVVTLEGFLNWYFDVFIVTDERIIDIDFMNLIYKNITATKIINVEDVTYNTSGVLASILNYGQILIQTAGAGLTMPPQQASATIEIWNTPHPATVAKLINELMLEEEQEQLEGRVR